MQLGIHLSVMKTWHNTEGGNATYKSRDQQIRVFLYAAIAITIAYPVAFILTLTYVIENSEYRDDTDRLVREDDAYKETIKVNKSVCVIINLLIGCILCISSAWAIKQLRWFFGGRFKREIQQITIVLVTFVVTFLVRIAYEAIGYLEYTKSIASGHYPCEFAASMEVICGCLLYFSFPIGLFCYLHYRNAQPSKHPVEVTQENNSSSEPEL